MSETETSQSREVFDEAGENSTDVIENKEITEAVPKRGRRSKDVVGNMNA